MLFFSREAFTDGSSNLFRLWKPICTEPTMLTQYTPELNSVMASARQISTSGQGKW